MAEPLKNMYNESFFASFCEEIKELLPNFDSQKFLKKIYTNNWKNLELKDRMYHVTKVCYDFFPKDYEEAIDIIIALAKKLKTKNIEAFPYMFLPDYVEKFGINHLEISLKAMEEITQFTSCEFAVRPFIIKYPEKLMKQMLAWSEHKHSYVRRFASEGCRPRLPWAMALPDLKKNPAPILPILENLKNDSSEFVRKSVANNLNDISKDNAEIAINIFKRWLGNKPHTNWIVKHAARTLLKQGNIDVMLLFGFGSGSDFTTSDFKLERNKIAIGENLIFSFKVANVTKQDKKLRLEYAIYYQKANGTLSKKVYIISEKDYKANSTTNINRKQSFKIITTRKFHKGLHKVALVLNGIEQENYDFILT